MHVRVGSSFALSLTQMIYVDGDVPPCTTLLVSNVSPSLSKIEIISFPVASSPIFVNKIDDEEASESRDTAVNAFAQLPPTSMTSVSLRVFSSGRGNFSSRARMSNPQLPTPNTAFSFSQHPPSNNVSLLFSDTFRRRRRVLVIWTRREDGRTRRPKDDESVGDDKKFVTILFFFVWFCAKPHGTSSYS